MLLNIHGKYHPLWIVEDKTPPRRASSPGWRGRVCWGLIQGEAGDGAAGDVFVGDGRHVGVSNILETTDSGGQDEPFGEGVHLFADTVGNLAPVKPSPCFSVGIGASAEFSVEDDGLDNHCHVGEVEVTFGAFPQADEDVVSVVAVAEGCAYAVPVEKYFFGVAVEYEGDIVTEVEIEIVDSTLGKG